MSTAEACQNFYHFLFFFDGQPFCSGSECTCMIYFIVIRLNVDQGAVLKLLLGREGPSLYADEYHPKLGYSLLEEEM